MDAINICFNKKKPVHQFFCKKDKVKHETNIFGRFYFLILISNCLMVTLLVYAKAIALLFYFSGFIFGIFKGGSSAGAPGARPPVWNIFFLKILTAEHA